MKGAIKAFLAVVAVLLGAGCVPTSLTYPQQFDFPLRATPRVPVLVAVQDQRPNSLKRQSMEVAAGMFRSDMGIPVHLFSTSRRPVADDLASAVVASLQRNGVQASTVRVEPARSAEEVKKDLMQQSTGQVILITILELKPDVSAASKKTKITRDLKATVFGKDGKIMGVAATSGEEIFDQNPHRVDETQRAITGRINKHITAMLNEPAIVKALK
jgi:hypothetical protein